ncbi:MAG: hypothetical protein U0R27_12965 [Candidatus Nanopelagicales bacterium]|jgi:hypothetical protein|nr:hypothetical protein [Actinomycetota bacterium]MCB0921986.1 hypothetical protein [Actinomycetota bacterium]HNE87727.1 hypothetical protein [Actinomycetota bacterium]HNL50345.1 hypothetical protein [Actinomycetota bacterium]HNO14610.1 hypothetical protein [Actinomycetota bacterium]
MSGGNRAVLRVAHALVPLEFRGIQGLNDQDVLADAGEFTTRLLQNADYRVVAPLRGVVLALDAAAIARYRRPFMSLPVQQQDALWRSLRERPGFAQLRQVVRTSALMRISEWEGFLDGQH